ncbi:MAG: molybdopterin biosynthesis protein [Haloarculaceae archaeon]
MHDHDALDLVAPGEARDAVAALGVGGATERVPLADAAGRVLAETAVADVDVPGFDRASKDGYAVRAEDTAAADGRSPEEFAVVESVAAGEEPEAAVGAGEAVEITTGAVLPAGADAVVMVEDVTEQAASIAVRTTVAPGENVMAAGTDIAAGDHALGAGVRLTARTVGLLAALGREAVSVYRRPRVAILPTGDELVDPGDTLRHEAGQIYDVNTPALTAAVEAAGGEASVRERVPDDPEALAAALESAAEAADLVLTAGATSAGATDVLVDVIEEGLGEIHVHGVAFKPGKPTIVGRVAGTPYVGLPGYPVSALSVFRALVAPAVDPGGGGIRPSAAATAARELRNDGDRHRLFAVGLVEDAKGARLAYPVDRGSGATTSLAYADGVVEIPAATDAVPAGDRVTVDLFDAEAAPPRLLCVGERDPVVRGAIERVDRARVLARPGRTGARWLADGIADAAVVTGERAPPDAAERAAAWDREWGLLTAPEYGDRVDGLADLADLSFVSLAPGTGLRAALEGAAAELTTSLPSLAAEYGEVVGLESGAARVRSGRADAALGLRATAGKALTFTPLGTQRVAVDVARDRREKPGVGALLAALDEAGRAPGYERVG